MERVFLDANILFSAAYRERSGLRYLWGLRNVELITSGYAIEEARLNLGGREERDRLDELVKALSVAVEPPVGARLPPGVDLPVKDRPILLAAIGCRVTHLLTGDATHFGHLYGRRIQGLLILPPSRYLQAKR